MLSETEIGIYGEEKKITVNRLYHSSDNWSAGYISDFEDSKK